jgi:hypothetical protein
MAASQSISMYILKQEDIKKTSFGQRQGQNETDAASAIFAAREPSTMTF